MSAAPPPSYTEHSEPLLLDPNGSNPANGRRDEIPDDFKWSDVVAECAIDIRHRFMQRVYAILAAQILVTLLIGGLITSVSSVHQFVLEHPALIIVALIGSFASLMLAMFKSRSYPWNLLALGLFTVFESYIVGVVSLTYDTRVVINALVVSGVIFAGLSLFALQTKYDFTSWAPYLGAALFGLVGFGFVLMFFPSSSVELAYSAIAVVVFSGYLLVDTQLVMTRFHPEDEVAASITLYLDIVNLFLNLLRILNGGDDN